MKQIDLSDISFLIVDDNNYMISIVKSLLKGFGAKNIYEARDAPEGFEEFRTRDIDIIICDFQLPTLDGAEFSRLVRTANDSPNSYVPIIMLSAYTEAYKVEMARDAGVTEFLAKPVSAKDLYERVVEVIERPRKFIKSIDYFGPDRRRHKNVKYSGPERRKKQD